MARVAVGQRRAGAQQERAVEMGREVPVAEAEPGLAPEPAHRFEAVERVVTDPPASRAVEETGQGVGDRVEIGRDAEPPPVEIVAGVADDEEPARLDHAHQAAEELRGPRSAREGDDHRRPRRRPSASGSATGTAYVPGRRQTWRPDPGRPRRVSGRNAWGMGTNPSRTHTRSSP